MGTSLSGLTPATTFDGLLKTSDNEPLDGTLKAISTGDGTDTILQLSNSALSIGGATTIVSDNTGNDIPFEVNTSSSGLLKIRNLNSATTPILGISHGSQDTRLSMYTTMGFRVQGVGIADMTSSEVRIGSGSGARLAVKGSGATSATTSLLVQNSAGTQLLKINDDGSGFFGTYLQGQRVYATATGETFPSLSFAGSSGTGMFQPTSGSNVIGFAVSGGEKARLDATGLGIGETTPTARLHVKGSGNDNTTTSLLVQNSDGADLMEVTDNGILKISTAPSFNTLNIYSDGINDLKRIGTATGLAIGTTVFYPAASTQVHIKGSGATSATTALLVQNSAGTTAFQVDDGGNIGLGNAPLTGIKVAQTSGAARFRDLYFGNIGSSAINNSSLTSINWNGSTGIGIANSEALAATAMLHIKGSGNDATTTALLVQNSDGTDMLKVLDDGATTIKSNGSFSFETVAGTKRIEVKANGEVNLKGGQLAAYSSYNSSNSSLIVGGFAAPDASAVLQVDSTTQGFLPPRMTTTERDAINMVGDPAVSTPAAGLIIYNTTTNKAQCYNGTTWNDLF